MIYTSSLYFHELLEFGREKDTSQQCSTIFQIGRRLLKLPEQVILFENFLQIMNKQRQWLRILYMYMYMYMYMYIYLYLFLNNDVIEI